MSYKNTVKLFASNFTLVWKQLLYLLICAILFGVCAYFTGKPIIELLSSNGVFHELKVIVETAYSSPSEVALKLSELFKSILTIVFIENFSHIWLSFFSLVILCLFLPYILVQMSFYNISSVLYQKISMNMSVGYIQNGLKTFKKSFLYALTNIIFSLPFTVLIILLLVIYLTAAKTILASIIGLVILSLLVIVLVSIKISIFSCYTGYYIENNSNPFVAFGKSFIMAVKNFWRILSTSIAVNLTLIVVNGFIAIFTFFAGIIVSIPSSFVFLAIYYLVVYFNTKGDRYYLSANLIFNPTKYEVKQDEVTIIEIPEKKTENNVKGNSNKKSTTKNKKDKSKNIIQNKETE